MRSKRIERLLLVCSAISFLSISAVTASEPTPHPTPFQTPTPPPVVPPIVNPEESIPVVIRYGQSQEARVQVYRGLMEPVGVPAQKSITVTILLPAAYAGEIVRLGRYDGGQIGPFDLPGLPLRQFDRPLAAALDGSVQFNFEAGQTLGLYRVLMTAGPAQFLLQFYAVKPRSSALPLPSPSPVITPEPPPL